MARLRALPVLAALILAPGALAQSGEELYARYCQSCHNYPGNNHNQLL